MPYMTIAKFSAESWCTEDVIRAKIKNGVWLESAIWRRAPDGRILIDTQGYETWVKGRSGPALI
jgi:hypothetical protein